MITCDTSALSQFLRRSKEAKSALAQTVQSLIELEQLVLFGVVRQEILLGVKTPEQFARLEVATKALPIFYAEDQDHVLAAQFYNDCRAKGVQGSAIDFLVCSMASRRKLAILTTDPDFELYSRVLPIELYGG